ncbi:glycine zipper family protein [Paraburkholderia adhaesiva]|uniref:glycine zipper family protein n=1 Tax=Paraburkholderia adhaesiva TaxID=2883244 RepID=UPI001F23E812|nr:glycine zipper family protein [Paraburkholderia adhaesiva]
MKNILLRPMLVLGATLFLCSCASTPVGPTVQVLPGQAVPFEVFQQEQDTCKQYAASQVEGQADRANASAVGTALLTTALGAAFGAATSWHGHAAGAGAAVGATAGAALGAGNSSNAQMGIQVQYNNAYAQCMYAKGNQVAGMAPVQYAPAY